MLSESVANRLYIIGKWLGSHGSALPSNQILNE